MAVTLLHTGQTGVERGAVRAARALGMRVEGFCSTERRDEFGPLPPDIAADLVACEQRGARSALRATLRQANVLVIAVPTVHNADQNTGIEALRRAARAGDVPYWLIDPAGDLAASSAKLRRHEHAAGLLKVMVTGPRFTRWHEGERLGFRVIAELSLTPRKHRILVVDDHRETAENVCHLLETLGHEAVLAETGRGALEIAERFDPDVGFFDLHLPDITGYELARRFRSAQSHPLFLAAITGWSEAGDETDSFVAGFDRHVVKPTTIDVIRSLIDQASQSMVQVS